MDKMQKESIKENKPTGIKTLISVLRPFREWLKQRPSPTPTVTSTSGTAEDMNGGQYFHQQRNQQQNHKAHPQPPLPKPPTPNSTVNGLVDQQFTRTARARMSLPIMQHHQANKLRQQVYSQLQMRGQQQAQSLGHIYLQHKGETKQASLPNELTAMDTIRALFVCAFPNMLTMHYMSQPHVKIYIYNPSCNIFYELRDIDDVRHESVLRIHHSDPILALQPAPIATTPFQHQIHLSSATQTLPPPKPRRMIPVNGLPPSPPDMIYGQLGPGHPLVAQQQQQQIQHISAGRPLHQMNQHMNNSMNQHHQRKYQSYTPTPVQFQQQQHFHIHSRQSPHSNHHQPMMNNQQQVYSGSNLHQLQHMQPMHPQLSHQ